MRLRSGQPCVRSYHSVGTQEYRLSIPVFRNSGRSRPTSGDCPNKSLTRHHAAAVGEVPPEAVAVSMIDCMGPSLDTTIFAISSGVWLFANHPDQWDLLRDDLSRIRYRSRISTTRASVAYIFSMPKRQRST